MSGFDEPARGTAIEIRLERISKTGDAELWWVAEGLADGSAQPRGVFTDAIAAEGRAEQLAATLAIPIHRISHID